MENRDLQEVGGGLWGGGEEGPSSSPVHRRTMWIRGGKKKRGGRELTQSHEEGLAPTPEGEKYFGIQTEGGGGRECESKLKGGGKGLVG